MDLVKQFPGGYHFCILSNDDKIGVFIKTSKVVIFDMENYCMNDVLDIKYCGYASFSSDGKILVLKTTTSKLYIYNLITREIVFSKKMGKNDGYNIIFLGNKVLTGDWDNNNFLVDLYTFEYKKFSIEGLGMCNFMANYSDKVIVCHKPRLTKNSIMVTLDDIASLWQNADVNDEEQRISFMDNEFKLTEYTFKNDNYMPTRFAFKNNNLYIADANRLNRIDIAKGEINSFYWEAFIISMQISNLGYVFLGSGFAGVLLNDKFEKIHDFHNVSQNAYSYIGATFFENEPKILISSNSKISIYKF